VTKKKPAKQPSTPGAARSKGSSAAKPGAPGASKPRVSSSKLEISPIAKRALLNSRLPTPPNKGPDGKPKLSTRQIDAIRQFAVALAEDGLGSDEDTVLICNRITEAPAIPLSELLYDKCRWCESDIYYDRLMPSPPGMMRVCVPCGIMLLEADKKGRN
jgi:hypothetical protein